LIAGAEAIFCIYLREQDQPLLPVFHATPYGMLLAREAQGRVYEVYASGATPQSMLKEGSMLVAAPESYSSLSLKTHEMIRLCVERIRFSHLVKIDVTCAVAAGHDIGSQQIVDFLSRPFEGDYFGIRWHGRPLRSDIEAWAANKQGSVNLDAVFPAGSPMPSWYSGKCYGISHRFAKFIAGNGLSMAREHAAHLMGSEDMMVGRLHDQFLGRP
jgi:hypothetical protein